MPGAGTRCSSGGDGRGRRPNGTGSLASGENLLGEPARQRPARLRTATTKGGPTLQISGTTRAIGVIGDPVDHTMSPAIHNAAFAALGLDYVYVPLPVPAARVGAAVAGLRALGFRGANVTMPHKAAVIAHLDEVSGDARLVDAVNTIVVDDRAMSGHNTDIEGFRRALRDAVPGPVSGSRAVLIGAGGGARAAALGLAREHVAELVIVNRSVARADELTRRLESELAAVRVRTVALEAADGSLVRDADIIVNASALGMSDSLKVPAPLVDNIRRGHIVYDVVYGKRPTLLLEKARARKARVVDGMDMLVWQAALAFELWTGRAAPLDVMRNAGEG